MKLTTDRHEASSGLFATAELLVIIVLVLSSGEPTLNVFTVRAAALMNMNFVASLYVSEMSVLSPANRSRSQPKSVHMHRSRADNVHEILGAIG